MAVHGSVMYPDKSRKLSSRDEQEVSRDETSETMHSETIVTTLQSADSPLSDHVENTSWQIVLCVAILMVTITAFIKVYGTSHGIFSALTEPSFTLTNFSCPNCNNFTFGYKVPLSCREDIFLLILVASNPSNSRARTEIRNTWGTVTTHRHRNIRTVFVLGNNTNDTPNKNIMEESQLHRDIVQGWFADGYENLTQKVVFGLQWQQEHCKAEFILKTDEDTFNIPQKFVDYLLANRHHLPDRFVGGRCVTTKNARQPSHRRYVPYDLYKYLYTPFYCLGMSYFMSSAAARDIAMVAPHVQYSPVEDMFVSGMCRQQNRIPYIHVPGTGRNRGIEIQSQKPCNLRSDVKSVAQTSPGDMLILWKMMTSADHVCKTTFTTNRAFVVAMFLVVWCVILYHVLAPKGTFTQNISHVSSRMWRFQY